MSFFTGTPASYKRLSNLDPQQQATYANLTGASQNAFGDAANYYRNLLSNQGGDFEAMAAPEMRRFNQQIIPDIAEQFAGAGSGALSSSGFQNSAVNAATDLSERLGALRARLRQQAAQGLQGIGEMGLRPFGENVYQQARPGLIDAIGPGIGAALGSFAGPFGTALGGAAGNWLSNRFGSQNQNQGGQIQRGNYGMAPTQGNYNPYTDQISEFR